MGDAQSSHVSGKTTLFEQISEDIGSGNEGDMLDMQCTVNQDPSVAPIPLLMSKDAPKNVEELEMMHETQESVVLIEEGGSKSITKEELTQSQRKRKDTGENSEEDEIELMFKMMD